MEGSQGTKGREERKREVGEEARREEERGEWMERGRAEEKDLPGGVDSFSGRVAQSSPSGCQDLCFPFRLYSVQSHCIFPGSAGKHSSSFSLTDFYSKQQMTSCCKILLLSATRCLCRWGPLLGMVNRAMLTISELIRCARAWSKHFTWIIAPNPKISQVC